MAKVHDHAMRGERERRGGGDQQRRCGKKKRNANSGRGEGQGDVRQKEIIQDKGMKNEAGRL